MALIQAKYQLRLSRDDKWHMDRPHFHEDVDAAKPAVFGRGKLFKKLHQFLGLLLIKTGAVARLTDACEEIGLRRGKRLQCRRRQMHHVPLVSIVCEI